ncbi:hypothetical protein PSZ77_24125, partial [Shigella sonnei]|nr:hypothetical protein [Shigella sonnei]
YALAHIDNLLHQMRGSDCRYELELPTVHIDNLTAAFDAVNYLYALAHIDNLLHQMRRSDCRYELELPT